MAKKKSKFEILQPNSMVDDRVQFWKDRILGVFRRALGKLILCRTLIRRIKKSEWHRNENSSIISHLKPIVYNETSLKYIFYSIYP